MRTRSAKGQLVGSPAAIVSPAWRQQHVQATEDVGSRILISKLPADVGEAEIEELFKKTVGPLKDSFVVYNSQGRSKGIAVVSFLRTGDAAVARQKYNGKIVDGRRPIKVEIVVDGYPGLQDTPPRSGPSLLDRLSPAIPGTAIPKAITNGKIEPLRQPRSVSMPSKINITTQNAFPPLTVSTIAINPLATPIRRKKGPKRVKKSIYQLDKEMEEYRAGSDVFNFSAKENLAS